MASHDSKQSHEYSKTVDTQDNQPIGYDAVTEDCYVRALYPFASSESSSLEFQSGEFIRVLTKLESGWWDGLLHGRRGWFPSNYVEEVEVVSSDEDASDIEEGSLRETPDHSNMMQETQQQFQASIGDIEVGVDTISLSDTRSESKEDDGNSTTFWIPQTSSEGHIFFFNTVTGESSWEIPFKTMTAGTPRVKETFTTPITTGFRRPSEPHPLAVPSPKLQKYVDDHSARASPAPQVNGIHAASSTIGWRDANGDDIPPAESSEHPDSDGEILLFAGSVSKPALSRVKTGNDSASVKSSILADEQAPLSGLSSNDFEMNDISDVLLHCSNRFSNSMEALKSSVEVQDREQYRLLCSDFKATTCEMFSSLGLAQHCLQVTSTTDHSPQPATSPTTVEPWKAIFNEILASITNLMLSSQRAGSDFGTDAETQKMLQDAGEVHGLVLSFITRVMSQEVVLPSEANLVSLFPSVLPARTTAAGWQGNALVRQRSNTSNSSIPLVQLSSEAVAELQSFKASIHSGVKACKTKLKSHDHDFSAHVGSTVLRDTIDILAGVRQMLAYCEQIDLSPLDPPEGSDLLRSPTITDFAKTKQSMYDACATLVLAAQGVTSLSASGTRGDQSDQVMHLNAAFATLETSISAAVLNLEFMVQEYVSKYAQYNAPQHENEIILTADPLRRCRTTRSLGDDHSIDSPVILSSSAFSTPTTSLRPTFQHYPANGQTPWFLEHEYESELSYDSKGSVKAGTLMALIERLTRHDNLDSVFNNTFLLTYRSFTTADELSSLLMKRFLIEPPKGLTASQFEMWVELKQKPVQLRVYNIFKSWMENFFVEPPNNATHEWLARLKQFVRTAMVDQIANAPILVKLIEKRIVQGDVPIRKMVLNTTNQAPMPIVPKNLKKIRLLDLDALEVARQLTIMESNLYNKIKPTECLDKSWSKPDAAEGAENIKAMILHSNQITAWVAEAILYQTDLKKRVNLIKHFVFIAEKCRQLHNFSALTAIISGLNSAPIHRLRRTWDLLPARAAVSAEDLNRLMNSSKNFSSYREALHQTQPPCVPFLGVYLTDLTFIEDGNPNMSIKARHLINISKRQKTADVIREIQQYQAVPFCLQPVPEIQTYIRSCMDITRDISELYNISLEREPREREDEKIARLLQESGFL